MHSCRHRHAPRSVIGGCAWRRSASLHRARLLLARRVFELDVRPGRWTPGAPVQRPALCGRAPARQPLPGPEPLDEADRLLRGLWRVGAGDAGVEADRQDVGRQRERPRIGAAPRRTVQFAVRPRARAPRRRLCFPVAVPRLASPPRGCPARGGVGVRASRLAIYGRVSTCAAARTAPRMSGFEPLFRG